MPLVPEATIVVAPQASGVLLREIEASDGGSEPVERHKLAVDKKGIAGATEAIAYRQYADHSNPLEENCCHSTTLPILFFSTTRSHPYAYCEHRALYGA